MELAWDHGLPEPLRSCYWWTGSQVDAAFPAGISAAWLLVLHFIFGYARLFCS